jgi:hypothetical protein
MPIYCQLSLVSLVQFQIYLAHTYEVMQFQHWLLHMFYVAECSVCMFVLVYEPFNPKINSPNCFVLASDWLFVGCEATNVKDSWKLSHTMRSEQLQV